MEKVVYADSYEQFFTEAGYNSVDDFFTTDVDPKITAASKRFVEKIELATSEGREKFFIKRFFYSHLSDAFHSLTNFGKFCSQGQTEYRNANLLISRGFKTYEPICYGESMKFGRERRSFFVSRALMSKSLTTFAVENMPGLEQTLKEELMIQLGKELRRIHDAGISMPDLYMWHIFVDEPREAGLYEFAFIDLHRMCHNINSPSWFNMDLGRLLFSMDRQYFPLELCRLLIDSYAPDSSKADLLWANVLKQAGRIAKRRKLKPYNVYCKTGVE